MTSLGYLYTKQGKFGLAEPLIPGLIDAHVHIADDQGDIERFRGLLSKLLLSGVTGVRDMAGDARTLGYLAREARLDAPGWPDIYYSALMAGPTFFNADARVAARRRECWWGVLRGCVYTSAAFTQIARFRAEAFTPNCPSAPMFT
jgi:hypothetical protein